MNANLLNLTFLEIKETLDEIKDLKFDIEKFKTENESKMERNKKAFDENMKTLNEKENKIKTLMENKHFTFIQYLDFIDERDIESNEGFELKRDLGFVNCKTVNTTKTDMYKKTISNEEKMVTFEFDDTVYSNKIDFSFKLKNGLPATPIKTVIEYSNTTETLFEPNFRHYNRNRADIFNNTFYFYPKKIKKVIFEFEDIVVYEQSSCSLSVCEYETSDTSVLNLKIKNEKEIKNFNLYKTTDESIVPLEFFISEDNIEFKKIEFNEKREAVFSLENPVPFNIQVKSRYDLIKQNIQYNTYSEIIPKSSLIKESGYSRFDKDDTVYSFDINFSHSSYQSLKQKIEELVYPDGTNNSDRINIDDVVESNNGIYKLKKNLIILSPDVTEKANSMIYQDDFSIVSTDKFYLNFILDVKNNRLYFSEFMEEFTFYLELSFEKVKEMISDNLITPYVFNLSLKG